MEENKENTDARKTIEMQHLSTKIQFSNFYYRDEMAYDAFLPSFKRIVDLRSDIIFPGGREGEKGQTFTFGASLVPHLYLAAFKCRNKILRRKAVKLMAWCGREGIWDGRAGVASYIIGLEECSISTVGEDAFCGLNGLNGEGGVFVDEEDRCIEYIVHIDRARWRALVVIRKRRRIENEEWEYRYFGGGVWWSDMNGDGEFVGDEREREDRFLFAIVGSWRCDLEALDFELKKTFDGIEIVSQGR